MNKLIIAAFVVLAVAAFSMPQAQAQSLKMKQLINDAQKGLDEAIANVNSECGTAMTASFDPGQATPAELGDNIAPYGFCSSAMTGIRQVCSRDEGKEAVKTKIKKVVCKLGETQSLSLADGVFTFTRKWSDLLVAPEPVVTYLENNL